MPRDLTREWLQFTCQYAQQARFAGAVCTYKAAPFTSERERNVRQDKSLARSPIQAMAFDQRFSRGGHGMAKTALLRVVNLWVDDPRIYNTSLELYCCFQNLLSTCVAAIDRESMPGNKRREVGAKPQNSVGDFLFCTGPAEGLKRQDLLACHGIREHSLS